MRKGDIAGILIFIMFVMLLAQVINLVVDRNVSLNPTVSHRRTQMGLSDRIDRIGEVSGLLIDICNLSRKEINFLKKHSNIESEDEKEFIGRLEKDIQKKRRRIEKIMGNLD